VKADGTGQYPTIQAAVDAAVDGDEVHLVPGLFEGEGNREIDLQGKAITIRSQNLDASEVVVSSWIDSLTDVHAFVLGSGEGSDTVIEALTISGLYDPIYVDGGLINCVDSSPTIRDCVFYRNQGCSILGRGGHPLIQRCLFEDNDSYYGNSIVSAWAADMIDCQFIENSMGDDGGGPCCAYVGTGMIAHCHFGGNRGFISAGALCSNGAVVEDCTFFGNGYTLSAGAFAGSGTIRRCSFSGNIAFQEAGAALITGTTTIENCDFTWNDSRVDGAAIAVTSGTLNLSNSIVAYNLQTYFDTPGPAVKLDGGTAVITCTDIFANECGDWEEGIADQLGQSGNISADPLYCQGIEGIYSNSPCAPANSNGCGLIGLYDVACEPSSVEARSWGKIKGLYR